MTVVMGVFLVTFLEDGKHIKLVHHNLYGIQYSFMNALPGSGGGGPFGMLDQLNRGMDGIETAGKTLKENTYEALMEQSTGEKAEPEDKRGFLENVVYEAKRFNASPGAFLGSSMNKETVQISITLLVGYVVFLMCWIVFFLLNAVSFMMNAILVALFPILAFLAIWEPFRPSLVILVKQFFKYLVTPMIAAVMLSFLHLSMDGAGEVISGYNLLSDSPDNPELWGFISVAVVTFVALIGAYPLASALVGAVAGPLGATAGMVAGTVGSSIMSQGLAAGRATGKDIGKFKKFAQEKY
ncbi:MAG: hypothetical protein FE835_18655 [Gammaproteobacteria bacterium]|nr:hypothetical protein [Gammaproteobacteria bacterium]